MNPGHWLAGGNPDSASIPAHPTYRFRLQRIGRRMGIRGQRRHPAPLCGRSYLGSVDRPQFEGWLCCHVGSGSGGHSLLASSDQCRDGPGAGARDRCPPAIFLPGRLRPAVGCPGQRPAAQYIDASLPLLICRAVAADRSRESAGHVQGGPVSSSSSPSDEYSCFA